jgi:hypothetical protein
MAKNKRKAVAINNMHSYFGKKGRDADSVTVDDPVVEPDLNEQEPEQENSVPPPTPRAAAPPPPLVQRRNDDSTVLVVNFPPKPDSTRIRILMQRIAKILTFHEMTWT